MQFCGYCGASHGSSASSEIVAALATKPSPALAVFTLILAIIQFAITGFIGMHFGSGLLRRFDLSQWEYRFESLKFWDPFTYIHPIWSLSAWRLRTEVVLLFLVLGFIWTAMFSGRRNVRMGSWVVILVFSSISAVVSAGALVQALVLRFSPGEYSPADFYTMVPIAPWTGGVTQPAILWLIVAVILVGLGIGGVAQNRK